MRALPILIAATLLALVTVTVTLSAQMAVIAYNRFAVILEKGTDNVAKDLKGHKHNPWPSKEACEAGIVPDTLAIGDWLERQGISQEFFDIKVTCSPAGNPA